MAQSTKTTAAKKTSTAAKKTTTARKSTAKKTAAAKPVQSKVIWDDSAMKSTYANVANVTGGREEVVLLFGMNEAWHAEQKEVKVKLAERVVMSPFAAKRLTMLLGKTVMEYEKKFGSIDIGLENN